MQVFVGNRCVGRLNRAVRGGQISLAIQEPLQLDPGVVPRGFNIVGATVTDVRLTAEWRSFTIDDMEIEISRNPENLISEYFRRMGCDPGRDNPEKIARMDRMQTGYRWKILKCRPEDEENLFDHPDFEPIETEPDYDQRSREHSHGGLV